MSAGPSPTTRTPAISLRRAFIWTLALAAITTSVLAAIGAFMDSRPWGVAATLPVSVLTALVAISMLAYVARIVRWRMLSGALGWQLRWRDAAVVYVGAFAFGATPGRVGELVRLEMMQRRRGVPWADTTLMMVADRLTDLLSVAALALAPLLTPLRLVLGAAGMVGVALLWQLRRDALLAVIATLLDRVRTQWRADLIGLGNRLGMRPETNYRALLDTRLVMVMLVLAAVAWVAEGLAFHVLLLALGFDVGVWVAVGIYSAATLAGALSMLPGGLGGFELTAAGLLVAVDVPMTEAVAAVAVIRLVTFWFSILLGLVILPASLARQTTGESL